MKTDTPRPTLLKNYSPPEYLIDAVDLDFKLHESETRVRAKLKVRANPAVSSRGEPLRLDGGNLKLERISVDRRELKKSDYTVTKTGLTLKKPPIKPFVLEMTTLINPRANKALQGLYQSRGIFCTQCEAQGFRLITYFLDRPDILSVYTVKLEADPLQAPVLLSNGNLRERGNLDRGKRHYTVWHDPHPKPCYLFALVGGDLSSIASTFTTCSGRNVDLGIYVERGKEDRAGWAMESLKKSMRWDEKRFGREYDLEVFNIVAVSDFNMGAMENKGLNIFNDRLILATAKTASDTMFQAIESVVAHEYFHNWTGNRITCRDWFQLCLKEGLTVYRDQEFSADLRSRPVQRIADVRALKLHQFPEDAGPLAHPVRPRSYIEINNFYTTTVYEKGAELVRMIATILGAKGFKAGMDLYFERHDGSATTIESFLTSFEDANDVDLGQFQLWYEQVGTPELKCALSHNKRLKTLTLEVTQRQRSSVVKEPQKPLHIPLRLGFLDKAGQDLPLVLLDDDGGGAEVKDGVIHVTKARQSFRFGNIGARPTPSLLRGFSAPVNLDVTLSDKDLEFLIAHDSDPYNRWQAANTYATRTIIQLVEARAQKKRSARGAGFARALKSALTDDGLEEAFRAALLELPSPADIAREIGTNVNYTHICAARTQLRKSLARTLAVELSQTYRAMASKGRFSPNARPAGRRALRNACLGLLVARETKPDFDLAAKQFSKASNMTDEAHALYLLASSNCAQREGVLAKFFERWQDDHIVIDTWFAAQARSPQPDALDEIRALLKHPRFSLSAPNKVRALVGNFVMMNPLQFNRPDGAGYEFLADQVLRIDPFNPQIAARLMNSLRSWRMLEPNGRRKAKRALTRVFKAPDLSRDVFEIVSKTLDG